MARWALALFVSLALGSCGTDDEGIRVDARFHAEAASAERARSILLIVRDTEGDEVLRREHTLTAADLPVGVRLVPQNGDATRRYRLDASLLDESGATFNHIRVAGTYLPDAAGRLDLWFDDACISVMCGQGQTCSGGTCVAACFEPSRAPGSERDAPVACPGAAPVYVDFAIGANHPSLCTDPATPCASIQYALDNYPLPGLGTEILIRGGQTYRESIEIRAEASGAMGAPTVLRAWPDTGMPLLDASGAEAGVRICCGATAAHHVVIEGLEISGASTHGVLLRGEGADFNVVRDCFVHDNGLGAPEEGGGSGITSDEGADQNLIEGNVVTDNRPGPDANGPVRGIVVDASVGVEVAGNRVERTGSNGIRVEGGQAVLVHHNVVIEAGGNGLTFWGDDHAAEHNVFCRNMATGIRSVDSVRLRLEHNTVIGSGTQGVWLLAGTVGATVRSNVLVGSGEHGLLVDMDTEDPLDSHNLYFENGTAPSQGAMPDVSGSDLVGVDPQLVDAAACDPTLAAASAARGAAHDGGDIGASPIP